MSNTVQQSNRELVDVTSAFERIVHWLFAGSCIVLFVSGFGLMYHSFTLIAALLGGYNSMKCVHNISGLVFAGSGLLAVIMWLKDGLAFGADDLQWIARGGGYLGPGTGMPEQGRFNAGQKLYYVLKAVTWLGMSVTGIIMWFPLGVSPGVVRLCYPVHALCVVLLAGPVVIHIFLGTIGNPGTLDAMISGKCTRAWAKLQHGKWLAKQDTR